MRFYSNPISVIDFRRRQAGKKGEKSGYIHSHEIDSVSNSFRARIGAIYLRSQRQLPAGIVSSWPVLEAVGRFPRQGPAGLGLHLDAAEQVRDGLPGQEVRCAATVVALCKCERGIECSAHDPHAHGTDQDCGAIERAGNDGGARAGSAQDVFGGHSQVRVFDVRAGAGGVAGGGNVPYDCKGAGRVALDIGSCDEEDHDRVGGLRAARGCSPANDALQVCAFEVPASAVSGPDLLSISAVKRR